MVLSLTPTLTLSVREALSANQNEPSPYTRDSETSETSLSGNFSWYRATRSLNLKLVLSSPFYLTTNQCNMPSKDHTDSAFTSELENLTELHQLSGLPTEHESRRTAQGFLIRGNRLPNCVPLPSTKKNTLRSWI